MCQYKQFVEQNEIGRISAGAGDGILLLDFRMGPAEVQQRTATDRRTPGTDEHRGDDAAATAVHLGMGLHQPDPIQEPEGKFGGVKEKWTFLIIEPLKNSCRKSNGRCRNRTSRSPPLWTHCI